MACANLAARPRPTHTRPNHRNSKLRRRDLFAAAPTLLSLFRSLPLPLSPLLPCRTQQTHRPVVVVLVRVQSRLRPPGRVHPQVPKPAHLIRGLIVPTVHYQAGESATRGDSGGGARGHAMEPVDNLRGPRILQRGRARLVHAQILVRVFAVKHPASFVKRDGRTTHAPYRPTYLLPYATLSPVCHRGDGCTCPCGVTWFSFSLQRPEKRKERVKKRES